MGNFYDILAISDDLWYITAIPIPNRNTAYVIIKKTHKGEQLNPSSAT